MSDDRDPFVRFDRAVTAVFGPVAGVVLFAMMALTCVDVVGRYFLSKPIYGGFEITEMLLAALIFCGLPLVTLRGEHVTVDVLDPITPEWAFRVQHAVACLISFVATGYLAWRLWIRAVNMDNAGETTAQLKFKLAYLTYAMSILMAFTAVMLLLLLLFRRPRRHVTGEGAGP
jgi:TRAP-type C4-dicarboxylate transport system permease small subunit